MVDKDDLAKNRTDWAEDRTALANERTFAAWMRTAMASLGIAIALQAIFGPAEPTWLARSAATLFVLTAMVIVLAAHRNACKLIDRLNIHQSQPISKGNMHIIGVTVALANLITLALLWAI